MTTPIFPALAGVTFPVIRSPIWSRDVLLSVSGQRTSLGYYTAPRYRYELVHAFLRSDSTNLEQQTLLAFFNRVMGSGPGLFAYTDPTDFTVTDQSIGAGDGSTRAFQLVRTMTGIGANSFVEPVWLPNGTPVVKVNGTPTVAFTLGATGLVTFTVAPALAATLTWTGAYYWPCRFDDSMLDFEQFAYTFWEQKKIVFSTEKLG